MGGSYLQIPVTSAIAITKAMSTILPLRLWLEHSSPPLVLYYQNLFTHIQELNIKAIKQPVIVKLLGVKVCRAKASRVHCTQIYTTQRQVKSYICNLHTRERERLLPLSLACIGYHFATRTFYLLFPVSVSTTAFMQSSCFKTRNES